MRVICSAYNTPSAICLQLWPRGLLARGESGVDGATTTILVPRSSSCICTWVYNHVARWATRTMIFQPAFLSAKPSSAEATVHQSQSEANYQGRHSRSLTTTTPPLPPFVLVTSLLSTVFPSPSFYGPPSRRISSSSSSLCQ